MGHAACSYTNLVTSVDGRTTRNELGHDVLMILTGSKMERRVAVLLAISLTGKVGVGG